MSNYKHELAESDLKSELEKVKWRYELTWWELITVLLRLTANLIENKENLG